MEIRQIQTFITIAQTKSFSKAAELLDYSQSAITVQIRILEEELQTRLFDRMGRTIALTSEGVQFLEYANNIMHEVNKANHIINEREELHSPLHIGTLESLCFSKLPSIMQYFRREHPKVPFKIVTGTPKELIHMMECNELDLIYFLDRPRFSPDWNKEMEVKEKIVFVASSKHCFSSKKELTLEEMANEPFFLTEKNENYRRELDNYLEAKGITITPYIEMSSTEFIIRSIEQNRGISFLPYFAVAESVAAKRLSILNVPELSVTLCRQIFYHKNKWKTKEMEEFIRLAKEDES